MTGRNFRLALIVFAVPVLLLIPYIAMLFTNAVKWTAMDFFVAGVLLMSAGLAFEAMLRLVKRSGMRLVIGAAILIVLLIVWAELAVGFWGTPFAGS